jgi:hypothetical protein
MRSSAAYLGHYIAVHLDQYEQVDLYLFEISDPSAKFQLKKQEINEVVLCCPQLVYLSAVYFPEMKPIANLTCHIYQSVF